MSDTPVLSLRDLRRSYPSGDRTLEVLKGADLDLYAGEIVGLIGPSGSGKSSLLHAAGLLERPTGGSVVVEGVEASKLTEKVRTRIRLRAIGFVYQFHHLLPEFTALDNVALPQMILGRTRRQAQARAEELLGRLGLAERVHHQPAQLSGGEQQRVAIARALANNPRVILADEPTGNLDPTTSGAVFKSLFDLVRNEGVSALIATHNMELASYMDRVFTIREGHLAPVERPAGR
jgi:lipoprotein-releasing system ATP-binding protein